MAQVLVAEDDLHIGLLVKDILEEDGHVVTVVGNGEAVLALARASRPDLLILDVMMPKMDGYSVHAALSRDEATRGIPTIVLTVKAGARELFLQASNVLAFIEKPFAIKVLRDAVRKALGGGR